jgi:16S rRNA (cytosine1402-N4)-methyltransferase
VFQAIRVAVNEELDILPGAVHAALDALTPGGRCAVISYHSGEDRIVKESFRRGVTGGCQCPPGLPCVCGAVPTLRLLTRGARRPSRAEIDSNRRAESARLRAAERLADGPVHLGPGKRRSRPQLTASSPTRLRPAPHMVFLRMRVPALEFRQRARQ